MIIDLKGMETKVLPHFNGGDGALNAKMFNDGKNKVLLGTLEKGSNIGKHTHVTSSEIIYILSGVGHCEYGDVVEELHPGDCHYCPKGHTHRLMNENDEPLVFFAVVPEQ